MGKQKGFARYSTVSGFAPVIILVITVIGIGIAYLGFHQWKLNQEMERALHVKLPSVQPTTSYQKPTESTKNTDPTVNWKTYTNSQLKFSIQYPPSFKIRNGTPPDTSIYVEPNELTQLDQPRFYFYLGANENSQKVPIKDVVTRGISDELKKQITFTKERVGSYNIYTSEDFPSQSGTICKFITTDESRYVSICLSPYNKNIAVQDQNLSQEQEKHLRIFTEILSTFRFAN